MLKLVISCFMILGLPLSYYSQIYMEMAMDSTMGFEDIVEDAESFFDTHGKGSHTGYKTFKRWEYWMKRCLDGDGKMMIAEKRQKALLKYQKAQQISSLSKSNPVQWTDLGPYEARNTSSWSSHIGRITSIGLDPKNTDHIIVGSPTGGIWQTLDGANSWAPIFDDQAILKIYSLAINPHNPEHYLAGTWGGGIYQSFDRGQSWEVALGVSGSTRIISIKISPDDPNVMLAVNEGGNIFKSFNGGLNWSNRLVLNTTIYDLEFKPNNSNVIYASGRGRLLISNDAGSSFSEVNGPWNQSGFSYNPMMMAVTPDAPNSLYILEADGGGFGALYLSEDGANTFQTQSDNYSNDNNILGYLKFARGGQAPRDMDIVVNPEDHTEIHVGGIMTYRSFDSGKTWTQTTHWLTTDPLPFIHADIDAMFYHPGMILFGTDGGLFISYDKAESFEDKTTGLGIRQFYRIDVTTSEGEVFLAGGSQDNGSGLYTPAQGWLDYVGADGMEQIIDASNHDVVYSCIQYGNIYKTKTRGALLTGGVRQAPGLGDWVTPFVQDPTNNGVLYQGKRQLYKSEDGSYTWQPISNFEMDYPLDTLMQSLAIAPQDNQVIVAGFEKQIFRTVNGGVSWDDISPDEYFMNVNYISIHPQDVDRLVVTLSGTEKRVIESLDGGRTWIDRMQNLPNLGAECAIYEGGPSDGIYLSMDPGVYYTNKDQTGWSLISESLPKVRIAELEIEACQLYAASYGRGLWSTDLLDPQMFYADLDQDGFGDDHLGVSFCEAPDDYIARGGDCNDQDPNIHPDAVESCNQLDDNCNLEIDEEVQTLRYFKDEDLDGYGNDEDFIDACTQPEGYVVQSGDCNDGDSAVNPNQEELCNGADDNCNLEIDEGLDVILYYKDFDQDGFGDANDFISACQRPVGYVAQIGDCDDFNALVFPGAQELCNDIDDDCDGYIDETLESQIYYLDADGDGFGDQTQFIESCLPIQGYVLLSTDCEDGDREINPQASEICNGIDDNCDGQIDENCEIDPCDGNYLVIHHLILEEYKAGTKLSSSAKIATGKDAIFTAGQEIELLPNFEVDQGATFEASILPCDFGVFGINSENDMDLQLIEDDIMVFFEKDESVTIEIMLQEEIFIPETKLSLQEFSLKHLVNELDAGDYMLRIHNGESEFYSEFTLVRKK